MFTLVKFFVIYLLHLATCLSYLEEKRLRNDLFLNYRKDIRPVLNLNNPVEIEALLQIYSVYGLKLDTGQLITRSGLKLKWKNEHLNWIPNNYGNITNIYVPSKEIWMPNVIFCNSVDDSNKNDGDSNEILLYYDGTIEIMQVKTLRTFCDIDVYSYPFDQQFCNISLCVPMQESTHARLKYIYSKKDEEFQNHLWDVEIYGIFNSTIQKYSFAFVQVYLARKTNLSSVVRILPAVILSIITVCVFLLPPESGEKVSLATTVFLTNVVYLVEIDKILTSNSKSPALIILYHLTLTLLCGLSTIGAIIVCKIQISNQDQSDNEKSDNSNDSLISTNNKVTPIKITDEEQNPATLDLDNPSKKSIQRKKKNNVYSNHRRLDNIFLGFLCVSFMIFSIIFGCFFQFYQKVSLELNPF